MGLISNEELVQKWLNNAKTKEIHASITEEHVWAFNDWLRKQGTAYEEGIDEKTKIKRLLLEIQQLEKQNKTLHKEKGLVK